MKGRMRTVGDTFFQILGFPEETKSKERGNNRIYTETLQQERDPSSESEHYPTPGKPADLHRCGQVPENL